MKQEVITIKDCNRCPHRYAETGEYPSDRCRLNGSYLHQHTVIAREDDPILIPRDCPLRERDHVVKISRRYRFGGEPTDAR